VACSVLWSNRMRHRRHGKLGIAQGAVLATAALLGLGALTIARGRRAPRLIPKRRPDMPALAGGRGLQLERAVTATGADAVSRVGDTVAVLGGPVGQFAMAAPSCWERIA
jgi:hypothetical protein